MEPVGGACRPRSSQCGVGGAVRALIVDHDNGKRAWIVLSQKRIDAASNHIGLVTSWNDRDNARPRVSFGRETSGGGRGSRLVALAAEPEPSPAEDEVGPDGERQK